MAAVEASQSQSIINLKDVLDASTANIPTLTAVGYAVTSSQPGRSESQKRLMAIRSARMAAMRDLAEQIHGLQVDSNTTVIDLVVQNDTFRGVVAGTIGAHARYGSIQPVLTPMKWFLKLIGKPSGIYCKPRGKRCSTRMIGFIGRVCLFIFMMLSGPLQAADDQLQMIRQLAGRLSRIVAR